MIIRLTSITYFFYSSSIFFPKLKLFFLFSSPTKPESMDWSKYYSKSGNVEFADIGCGYGGLLITLGELFPHKLSLGMEIRVKVSDYVQDRIKALRSQHPNNSKYGNVACIRSNAMKFLPNFFHKAQLEKMFFLYPDPHFKRAKYKWRIVNYQLLAEYAYVLRVGVSREIIYDLLNYDFFIWIHQIHHK